MGIIAKNMEIERLAMSKVEIFSNKKIPVKTVYWLSRLQKELDKLLRVFIETRTEVFKKYCVKNDDGTPKIGPNGQFQFPPENSQVVIKEVSELANMEVEVIGIDKIKLNLDAPGLEGSISAEDLTVLEPFIQIDIIEAL